MGLPQQEVSTEADVKNVAGRAARYDALGQGSVKTPSFIELIPTS